MKLHLSKVNGLKLTTYRTGQDAIGDEKDRKEVIGYN